MLMRLAACLLALSSTFPSMGCSGVEVEVLSRPAGADLGSDPGPGDPLDLGRPMPPRCSSRRQGDGRTCQSATLWKLSAQLDCRSRGERLDVLMPFDPCAADRFRFVSYMCCTGGPTPTPGPLSPLPPPPGPLPAPPLGGPGEPPGSIVIDHDPARHGGVGS